MNIPEDQQNNEIKEEKFDDSRIVLMMQENPNMPDSAVVQLPDVYQEDANIIQDEESEGADQRSVNRLRESSSRSSNNKESPKDNSNSDSLGEAEVKMSGSRCAWVYTLLSRFTLKNIFS